MADLCRPELLVNRRDHTTSPEHGVIQLDELNTVWENECKTVSSRAIQLPLQTMGQSPSTIAQLPDGDGPVREIVLTDHV